MTEEEFRISIGAYLLDALEPAEALQVQTHLVDCAECRKEYLELTEVLPALATLPRDPAPEELPRPEGETPDSGTPEGDLGLRRALRQVVAEQPPPRRRRWRRRWRPVWLAVAAAVVVLTAVATGMSVLSEKSSSLPTVRTVTGTNAVTGARLTGTLRPDGTGAGSRIQAELTGGPPGMHCHLQARATSGSDGPQRAGEQVQITDRGRATWANGTVSIPVDRIDRLEVVDGSGHVMVQAQP